LQPVREERYFVHTFGIGAKINATFKFLVRQKVGGIEILTGLGPEYCVVGIAFQKDDRSISKLAEECRLFADDRREQCTSEFAKLCGVDVGFGAHLFADPTVPTYHYILVDVR
jgi:hypothetical protein